MTQAVDSKHQGDSKSTLENYLTPDKKPQQSLELPRGTFKEYRFPHGETLYTWQEKGQEGVEGTLSHNVVNLRESSQRLRDIFEKLDQKYNVCLETSLEGVETLVLNSYGEEKSIERESMPLDISLDNKIRPSAGLQKYSGSSEHPIDNKYFWKTALPIYLAKLGTAITIASNMASSPAQRGLVLGTFIFGAVTSGLLGWLGSKLISKNEANKLSVYENIYEKVKNELDSVEELKQKDDQSNNVFLKRKYRNQIREKIEHLSTLTDFLLESTQNNTISFKFKGKNEKEVLDYFNWVRLVAEDFEESEVKQIEVSSEKDQERIKREIAKRITVKQKYQRDKQYGKVIETEEDKYKLEELIGEGGLSKVYRAKRLSDDQIVALKLEKQEEESLLKKKKALVKTLKGLVDAPHMVSVYDSNLLSDPACIVTNFVEGADLRKIINELKRRKCYLSASHIFSLAQDTLEALTYAHSNGDHKRIQHNDIKPENILIDKKGRALITDFDLAVLTEENIASGVLFSTLGEAGTIDYMAPERRGLVKAKIDERADIYSFGIVFNELITREIKQRYGSITEHPEFDEETANQFESIISKCTAEHPNDRYQSIAEVHDEINGVFDSMDVTPQPLDLVVKVDQPKKVKSKKKAKKKEKPKPAPAAVEEEAPVEEREEMFE